MKINLGFVRFEVDAASYKEATLYPTNPHDHAAGWEADLVNASIDRGLQEM